MSKIAFLFPGQGAQYVGMVLHPFPSTGFILIHAPTSGL